MCFLMPTFVGLSLSLALSAFAIDETPYARWEREFEGAKVPLIEELKPMLTGRCYFRDDPTVPVAGLLGAFGTHRLKLVPMLNHSVKPDFYDRFEKYFRPVLERILTDNAAHMTEVRKGPEQWEFQSTRGTQTQYILKSLGNGSLLLRSWTKKRALYCNYFAEPYWY